MSQEERGIEPEAERQSRRRYIRPAVADLGGVVEMTAAAGSGSPDAVFPQFQQPPGG